jgi:hypothetical protein
VSTTITELRSIELARRGDTDTFELADAIFADVFDVAGTDAGASLSAGGQKGGLYA